MARILLVESDPTLRRFYQEEFEKEGYEVVDVGSGNQALEKLRQQEFDVIVLEILLPDIYGFELMVKILSQRRDLPIIINSDCVYARNDFHSWGADAFIPKSQNISELKNAVNRVVPIVV